MFCAAHAHHTYDSLCDPTGGDVPASAAAAYVGGTTTVEGDGDSAYVAVAFGNGGNAGGDAAAMTVLQQLLGGSSSRSDGLGGTVNSRLNKNVASVRYSAAVCMVCGRISMLLTCAAFGTTQQAPSRLGCREKALPHFSSLCPLCYSDIAW